MPNKNHEFLNAVALKNSRRNPWEKCFDDVKFAKVVLENSGAGNSKLPGAGSGDHQGGGGGRKAKKAGSQPIDLISVLGSMSSIRKGVDLAEEYAKGDHDGIGRLKREKLEGKGETEAMMVSEFVAPLLNR